MNMDQYQNIETIADQYQKIEKIGEGTYGVVYKAMNLSTKKICALKKIRMDRDDDGVPGTAIREISILKEMQHENIVKLQDVLHHGKSLWIELEYLDMDLKKYMDSHPEIVLNPRLIRRFLHQILCGIAYCHSHRIMHRDLKPSNLLLDIQTDTLKLADFGLARAFDASIRAYSQEVVSLWYRAPELLLGFKNYSHPVDMWSAGCIFAEMLRHRPLFSGTSEIEQLFHIFRLFGTPDDESWPGVCSLPYFQPVFPRWTPQDLRTRFAGIDPAGFDLLSQMLQMDPARRITAKAALLHDYFKNVGERPSLLFPLSIK